LAEEPRRPADLAGRVGESPGLEVVEEVRGRPLKFTPEQDEEVARLYDNGMAMNAIAVQMGVAPQTVKRALARKGVVGEKRYVDHTGEVHGTKKILGFYCMRKRGLSVWSYVCLKCGFKANSSLCSIKYKCKQCSFKSELANTKEYLGCGDLNQSYYLKLKRAALRRGMCWGITPEFIWELYQKQGGKCGLSGRPIWFDPKWKGGKGGGNVTASIDRVDSARGYEKDNVWLIHKSFQFMKMDLTVQEFYNACLEVTKNLVDPNYLIIRGATSES
jgi:hypothetical protein